ncbi:GTP-binding protein [Tenacibaculum amylolyticum]|uniref:GTP-binding protein n=1 Tax=Tenacibaculum amylolyticum TaxID=104269 RepID=UPI003893D9C5
MDDQLYNQIFLKPRFQIDFGMNADVLVSKISKEITDEKKYKIKLVDNHMVIDIPEKENHYWSPQLNLEIEELTEKQSKIRGLFGPKPQVWTLFMFIHFGVATAFLIFATIAYTNFSLGKSNVLSIVMLVVLPVVWVTLYLIGRLGKSTGEPQMDELKKFTKQLLKKIKENNQ